MKTLTLKHEDAEVSIPYDLPDSLRFDCFVPGEGVCTAWVDVRSEEVEVTDVMTSAGVFLDWAANDISVIEQAGDVCMEFEYSLLSQIHIRLLGPESKAAKDAAVLAIVARMAVLESDLHTEWCRLPDVVTRAHGAPPDDKDTTHAKRMLQAFIDRVLAIRAQDVATAAAKKRQSEWEEEQNEECRALRNARLHDIAIKAAKEER